MSTEDVTRLLHQPWKHYGGARLQMARPTIDSDFNEDALAQLDDLRRATLAIVGASGRVDDGFMPDVEVGETLVAKLVRFGSFFQAFVLDWSIRPGTMYVGGRRYEQPALEPAVFQREYLQMGPATAPRAAVGTYRQLAYLRGWDQPVAAIEDAELLEAALGGADSTLRQRSMRRVEVRNVSADDCASALAEVVAQISDGVGVEYDAATCELRSTARLQMRFLGEPAIDCQACSPSLAGRYLGHENHTIRLMLATPDSYVWAFDDAAPLYRVRLVVDGGGGAHVELLTPPKDAFHHPRTNTVVEFLPWSALLDNGQAQGKLAGENVHDEKVATGVGFFAHVDVPYDAAQRTMHVRLSPAAAIELALLPSKDPGKAASNAVANLKNNTSPVGEVIALRWDEQHPLAHELDASTGTTDGFEAFVYMRVWHRKASDEALTIPAAGAAPLGATGLVPLISGPGRAGDYWVFSVRPSAPDEIVPLEIMRDGGIAPLGPREVLAPISLLEWQSASGIVHELLAIHDCRPRMRALTDRGCDTFVVGPAGVGDFTTIQAAIDALPASGGRIRVLSGTYSEELRIAGRTDVVIVGCGARTIVVSPAVTAADALVTVDPGSGRGNVVLRDLALTARGQIGVAVSGERIACERLLVRAEAGRAATVQSAIRVLDGRDVRIVDNRIEMAASLGDHAAIYIESPGLGVVVERNEIGAEVAADGRALAWGGIHIGSGTRDVEVRSNRILGGRGHGVTLGSVVFRAIDGRELLYRGAGFGQSESEPPFAANGQLRALEIEENGEVVVFHPDPGAALENIVIADNEITGMGGSGVSSLAMRIVHAGQAVEPPLCLRRATFETIGLRIVDNRIDDNVRITPRELDETFALGGIALSEATALDVLRNRIEENGRASGAVCCGIYVRLGTDLAIEANRVRGNGSPRERTSATAILGGIVLGTRIPRGLRDFPPVIHDALVRRNVVEQPAGPALFAIATGSVTVAHNHLEARVETMTDQLGEGAAAYVASIGQPWEATNLPQGEPTSARWIQPIGSRTYLGGLGQRLPGPGGAVLFAHNQVQSQWLGSPEPGIAVVIVSNDAVTMLGNQLGARVPPRMLRCHALAIGASVAVVRNRIAENLEATDTSLVAATELLVASADNLTTHCLVTYGGANQNNPDYFADSDNLVWLRPIQGCAPATDGVLSWLPPLLDGIFGPFRFLPAPVFTARES